MRYSRGKEVIIIYDYTVVFDTRGFSGHEGDDAWERDNCPLTITCTEGMESIYTTLDMTEAYNTIHETHSEFLNHVMNNELLLYEVRLRYEVDVKCECGKWTTPRWNCLVCFRYACHETCHTCDTEKWLSGVPYKYRDMAREAMAEIIKRIKR